MLRPEEEFVQKQIGGMTEFDESIALIKTYLHTQYSYDSKNVRLAQWKPDRGELYELVLAIFTLTLQHDRLTYQAVAGTIGNRIDMPDHIDQIKTVAECIALISRTGLIDITRPGSTGEYIMVSTQYMVKGTIPIATDHMPSLIPIEHIDSNWSEEHGSMILGGSFNHHEKDICLDHLNRMNKVELTLYRPLLRKYEEAPKKALNTIQRQDQWHHFIKNSYRIYIGIARKGNRFRLLHRVDKRGRTYAAGYHVNTQGSSFKKAIIQFANKELVEM